jgi:hypothetical protein
VAFKERFGKLPRGDRCVTGGAVVRKGDQAGGTIGDDRVAGCAVIGK